MNAHADHPNVRALARCPLCTERKPAGHLVCWPCYGKHGLRNGNDYVEAMLEGLEGLLVLKLD